MFLTYFLTFALFDIIARIGSPVSTLRSADCTDILRPTHIVLIVSFILSLWLLLFALCEIIFYSRLDVVYYVICPSLCLSLRISVSSLNR